jgi:hypothetical protein
MLSHDSDCLKSVFLSLGAVLGAGDSLLKGRIVRSDSKEPVPDNRVRLVETEKGAITDDTGQFILESIKPGSYPQFVSHPRFIERKIALQTPDV